MTRASAGLLAAALLCGCATHDNTGLPPPPEDIGQVKTQAGECNRALAALIGGAIGAVIYEENRARGAAVGAGLGTLACAIINATSRELRSAAEVEGEYRAGHGGRLPDVPTLSVYDTAYNAAGGVRPGQEARIVSSITLVPGTREPVRDISEVLEVLDPEKTGSVLIRAEKRIEEAGRGGAMQNTFNIRLPHGMASGNYPARTLLYVNRKPAGENRGTLRVLAS
jgi:hypothetical protein